MTALTPDNIVTFPIFGLFLKGAVLLILIFYAIFALLIIRQVDLMVKTLITPVSPVLKVLAVVNAGAALGLIILTWGAL